VDTKYAKRVNGVNVPIAVKIPVGRAREFGDRKLSHCAEHEQGIPRFHLPITVHIAGSEYFRCDSER